MKKTITRIVIFPKDVQKITGQSPRHSRRILNEIRESLGKEESQYVTIEEFCTFKGLPLESVISLLDD